jgi:hypothetical protein
MDTKCIHHIHPHSPFPCAPQQSSPPPIGTHPQGKTYFSLWLFIFLKCILRVCVWGVVALVLVGKDVGKKEYFYTVDGNVH